MVRERKNPAAIVVKQTNFLEKLLKEARAEDVPDALPQTAREDVLEVLVFEVETERCAIPIEWIKEIIRYVEPTSVPHTVDFLEGIISLRGEMIPLISGRKRLGRQPKVPDRKSRIIILEDGPHRYGILVDAVAHVTTISRNKIEPPPSVLGPGIAAFIDGIAEQNGQMLTLLNLRHFLEFS
jgi:purine-binding chemotaxis protein CheW